MRIFDAGAVRSAVTAHFRRRRGGLRGDALRLHQGAEARSIPPHPSGRWWVGPVDVKAVHRSDEAREAREAHAGQDAVLEPEITVWSTPETRSRSRCDQRQRDPAALHGSAPTTSSRAGPREFDVLEPRQSTPWANATGDGSPRTRPFLRRRFTRCRDAAEAHHQEAVGAGPQNVHHPGAAAGRRTPEAGPPTRATDDSGIIRS